MNSNWSYSPETVKLGRDLCDLDLWPWPFAWTSHLSLVTTSENFMMIRWWEHSQKGVTDRQTDGLNQSLSWMVAAKNGDILHGTFPDIFIDKIICISNKISLACVPVALIDNKPVSVPVVARQRAGEKPQTEPMMTKYVLSDRWMLIKTLNVRGPSYLGLTRSISWLLMPWLLTSPGHQQPWYWLYRICRSFSYLRKDFKYLCHINVEEWHKMQIYVYVPSEKFSTQRVKSVQSLLYET